jgi:microcystin-dependent protein
MPSLDFPTSPTVGDQYKDWIWNGAQWDFGQTLPGGLPAGAIIQWGGATAPVNWLLCDGTAVSRTTYSSLFAAVGTSYGAGDGTTTFNLPDLRGRVPVGKNGGSFGTLGATGGAETVALDGNNLPAHTHTFSGTTSSDGNHAHNYTTNQSNAQFSTGGGTGMDRPSQLVNNGTTTTNGAHTHTYSGTTSSAGSGTAHNNLQPYQVVNYIIKATAAVTPGESELAPRVGVLEAVNSGTRLTALELADSTTNKSGLVPIIPTSISVSSGSGSVNSTGLVTATGWGTLKIQGVFTGAYRNYRVILDVQSTSVATEITGDLLTGSTVSGTQYRTWRPITGLTANTNVIYNYNDGVYWFNMGRSSGTYGCLTIADIFAPNVSGTYKRFLGQTIEAGYQMLPGALNGTTAAYDGFQLAVSGTATTATVRVYGYN